ncbi:MAG: Pre-mRNA-splicing factor ATP-dependent RNA helicase PRP16 [Paramarteilia canceri]
MKDLSSDMAQVCKEGSALVRYYREQSEKRLNQKKHWELGGTQIGNILGIQKKGDDEQALDDDQLKESLKFNKHSMLREVKENKDEISILKSKMLAARAKLPVYSVKQQFLDLVRHNNILIIVI